MAETDRNDYRLPRTVDPRHYRITLEPDLSQATFTGREDVQIQIHQAVSQIVLNAVDLEIHSAVLVDARGSRSEGRVGLDPDQGRAVIEFERTAAPGLGWLSLGF